jgi:hypothetical protein
MSQFNFGTIVASTKSGSGLAADLNAWRDALHTQHKGPARPSYAVPGLGWLKDIDTPWIDFVYDGVSDAVRGFINPDTHRYALAGNAAQTIASGGVTAQLGDWGALFNMTGSAAQTVAIVTKDNLMAGWWIRVIAQDVTVTINPYGAEQIDGLDQVLLPSGSSMTVFYDGNTFYSDLNGGGASAFPVGGISYLPALNPPNGFVRANGALLSRVTYAGLWGFAQQSSNIAPTDAAWQEGQFSPGNGTDNFRIPDLRGTFMRSWDNGRGVDSARALGSLQADDNKSHGHAVSVGAAGYHAHSFTGGYTDAQGSHQHGIGDGAGAHIGASGSGNYAPGASAPPYSTVAGSHNHNAYGAVAAVGDHVHSASASAAGGVESRPKNVALLACIKY